MTILQKLKTIEKAKCIYNIHYCNAGVGFCFYEPPKDYIIATPINEEWRKYLNTHKYYPTFIKAVNAEYKKLTSPNKQNE